MASTKYFPFCPRIPWKVKAGIYIVPELTGTSWQKANENRTPIVVCNGGLFEAMVSLSFFEMYNFIAPATNLRWSGSERFHPLLTLNNLSTTYKRIDVETLRRFPLPVFMDMENNLYYNSLYNYLELKPYYGGRGFKRHEPAIKQIVSNTTQEWRNDYLPKIRNWSAAATLIESWARTNKFQFKLPYVCIFTDRGFSMHNKASALRWTEMEVKALAAILKPRGIQTVVITSNAGHYYNSKAVCIPPNLSTSMYLLQNAALILSEEPDWLLVGGMISNAKIAHRRVDRRLDVKKNMKFLGRTNDILRTSKLRPIDVFNFLESSDDNRIFNDRYL